MLLPILGANHVRNITTTQKYDRNTTTTPQSHGSGVKQLQQLINISC